MTNTPWAPWVVVEGTDDRYRSLTVGQVMLQAMQKKLASTDKQESAGGTHGACGHRWPQPCCPN
jgi:hypothetical protein